MCATVLQAVERPLTADCRVAVYFSSLNGDPPFISLWPRIDGMNAETPIEEDIFDFTCPDDALEGAASANYSIGFCTDARVCPISE